MASTMVKTISVSEIAEMSDAELAEFMKRCRLPNGNYDLSVDDWHKLSHDERGRLARILEAKKRDLAASPTACSYSLDLDDLDARLRQVSPKGSFSSRPEPQVFERQRVPTPPIERHKFELRAYHQLLENGGRPLYPVSLINNMHNDPDSYAEILLPWQEDFLDIRAEGIFERQLRRWQDFRKWQNDNRGCEDDDGGYHAYVEREKRLIKEDMTEEAGAELIAKIEADPSRLKTGWNLQQFLRSQDRRFNMEHGCQGFHDYKAAVKRRLARHGFTQPFELDEDSKNQDKLTTWIEYLNCEYWWLDKYVSDIERLQPEHDRLWQALVNKNVLEPHETKEFVRTPESGMETQTAKNKALIAVQQAELKAKQIHKLTQEDPNRFDIPSDKRISMMKKSTENLLAAKRQLEQTYAMGSEPGSFD
ncbi:hypothetical protein A9K55_000802 [Cordyceps militaris]|uniref:Uncharacterized protein n=1 Tax=Cordyceps militaris TaxID=73501 RepID=A0A2H4SV64_CORMI|nr:hypothetical protein A9K55_000802 [Cordyceps militaris]